MTVPARRTRIIVGGLVGSVLLVLGVWVTTSGGEARWVATDVAEEAGLAVTTHTWSVAVADLVGDTEPDLVISGHEGAGLVYEGSGSGFQRVVPGPLPQNGDRHHCSVADVDLNGLPDIYCSFGAARGKREGPNELLMQDANGIFTNRASEYGVEDPLGRGRHTTFLDANRDGYPDLFVGNATDRPDGRPSANRLFINRGGTRFEASPRRGLDREIGTNCARALDFNRDGFDDLLICTPRGIRLYWNEGGERFGDVSDSQDLPQIPRDVVVEDLDGDGNVEIVQAASTLAISSYSPVEGFIRTRFERGLTASQALATGDATGDGLPDIYLVQGCREGGDEQDFLWVNLGNLRFEPHEVPGPEKGCGDSVAAIDYDSDGDFEFVVLNGDEESAGPIQLIDLIERS